MIQRRETRYTNCGICLSACGLEVEVENNQVVSVRGDKRHPLSRGFLCVKGRSLNDFNDDKLRVTSPYARKGDVWSRVSWDQAYAEIAERLEGIVDRYGPRSVAMYYGAGNPLSSINIQTAMGFLRALGSDRMYNVLTVEFTNRYYAMEKMYGKQYRVSQPDLENTAYLLILGSNPLASLDYPGITAAIKGLRGRNARMVVVDPRETETAKVADVHVSIKPGTDLFFLQAMLHHIFTNKLQDEEFLRRHTINHEFFRKFDFATPEEAESICGVPAKLIEKIAEEFATADSANAVCKLGILTSLNSTLTYWLVEALNSVTGNVDKPGGLIFNPGVFNIDTLLWLGTMGKRPRSFLGGYPYLTGSFPASELPREILMHNSNRVRALIVDAGNPALIFPNSKRTDEALETLELLISIDIYMNETAQRADYFLPAANFLEKDDLYVTFPDHQPFPFAQWTPAILEPAGESKAEWEIFKDLSRVMGLPIMNNLAIDVLFKAGELVGRKLGDPNRFSFKPENYFRVLSTGLGRFSFSKLLSSSHGLKAGDIVFGEALKRFGKIDLAPQEFVRQLRTAVAPVAATDDFPLTLITGERTLEAKCTNLRGVKSLIARQAGNCLRIHPEDAALYGIEDGGLVTIATSTGSVVIRARVGPEIRKGVVSMGSGWGRQLFHPEIDHIENQGANANELTDDNNLDAIVGMPVYNAIPCSVRAFAR
jgi:anaerobic selenocysteine-containing dehydrogenase